MYVYMAWGRRYERGEGALFLTRREGVESQEDVIDAMQ